MDERNQRPNHILVNENVEANTSREMGTQKWKRIVSGALNSGELVAGVADEHAGLPHSTIPNRDALDELGHRARRRRRAHFFTLTAVLPNRNACLLTSLRSPSLTLCRNACVNAAPFLYCEESERVVANILFRTLLSYCSNVFFIVSGLKSGCM